jgi:hypothetical protein
VITILFVYQKRNKMKIIKRDAFLFILGIITFLVFEIIYNWDGSQKAFLSGWYS